MAPILCTPNSYLPDGLIRNGDKSIRKLNIYEFENRIGIQLYGHLIDAMTEAAIIAEKKSLNLLISISGVL